MLLCPILTIKIYFKYEGHGFHIITSFQEEFQVITAVKPAVKLGDWPSGGTTFLPIMVRSQSRKESFPKLTSPGHLSQQGLCYIPVKLIWRGLCPFLHTFSETYFYTCGLC